MPEQFPLFGSPEAPSKVSPGPASRSPPPLPPAVDPRQGSLFDGHLPGLHALEAAFEQLDVAAARAEWERSARRFPDWACSQTWPRWIEDLAWLIELERTRTAEDDARQVLALQDTGSAGGWLAGMRPELRGRIVGAALARIAAKLLDRHGSGARLQDGRPAGYLLLAAGRAGEAAEVLASAVAVQPQHGMVRGYLGEALWRAGRRTEAVAVYRDAYLLSPGAVDEELSTCTPIHDLLDRAEMLDLRGRAGEWVAVLGDLEGVVPLLGATVDLPPGDSASQAVARLLASYRRHQQAGAFPETERLALKREMLQRAPQLRELIRRL